MSTHTALVAWQRGESESFTDQRYSRRHEWRFDGGARVLASASPSVVPLPMLWFLSLAAGDGWTVDHDEDEAEGRMGRDGQGRIVITSVTLRPLCRFGGERQPSPAELQALHHRAHEASFKANSVRCEVRCEPRS